MSKASWINGPDCLFIAIRCTFYLKHLAYNQYNIIFLLHLSIYFLINLKDFWKPFASPLLEVKSEFHNNRICFDEVQFHKYIKFSKAK